MERLVLIVFRSAIWSSIRHAQDIAHGIMVVPQGVQSGALAIGRMQIGQTLFDIIGIVGCDAVGIGDGVASGKGFVLNLVDKMRNASQ